MNTRTTAFAALFALATAGLAAEPVQLTSIDPLMLPAPTMLEPMSFAPDPRSPAEKIQPMLWEEVLRQGTDAVIPIIITLHEPLLAENLRGATAQADAYRVQWVASLAHEFALLAAAQGAGSLRGLSHFPILFGEVRAGNLLKVAGLRNVQSIRQDEIRHATRAQGSALMNATTLRNSFGGAGAGKGIAIFDTGVDVSHPEFAGRSYVNGNYSGSPGVGNTDVEGHGTSCAGIALGFPNGMAPNAKLWTIKVLGDDGSGSDSGILSGLNAVYGARTQYGGVHILSLSLGGGGPHNSDCDALYPDFASVFNAFVGAGISIFAASGNEEYLNGIGTPACLSSAIAVGAVTDAPNVTDPACPGTYSLADTILCYSNSGVPLDILAPSACANTTQTGGGYRSCFNGTSAATPYAAGVAAQILSLRPTATPAQLKNALMSTGRPITDVNSITRNRIDAVQAYQALGGSGGGPCVQNDSTLCLLGDRFEVKATYTDYSNNTGSGHAVELTPDSGYFWFFDASNVEAVGKVVSFCPINGSFGFYAGGLTDVGVVMTVRDTVANQTQTFTNSRGHNFNMISSAFNTCGQ